MTKVLIVDDSVFMRKAINTLLATDQSITVCGMACNGEEAVQMVKDLDPDVVTLDIEMPKMDGLTALKHIMKSKPTPIIMVSSLTEEGAEATLKALEYGALDFIPKSLSSNQDAFAEELTKKVKILARKKSLMQLRFGMQKSQARQSAKSVAPQVAAGGSACQGARDFVAIGVSTGGPPAVQKVLSALPENFSATILIAQHMPASFTGPFAKRLDSVCKINVSEAVHGERPRQGHAYIAPGGKHITLKMRGPMPEIVVSENPTEALYKPSATELMHSMARCLPRKSLGIILTGMGSDGLEGIRELKEKGGYIMAQNEASCVVYGMPKAIVDAKLADQILDIDNVADALMTAVKG